MSTVSAFRIVSIVCVEVCVDGDAGSCSKSGEGASTAPLAVATNASAVKHDAHAWTKVENGNSKLESICQLHLIHRFFILYLTRSFIYCENEEKWKKARFLVAKEVSSPVISVPLCAARTSTAVTGLQSSGNLRATPGKMIWAKDWTRKMNAGIWNLEF